MNITRRTLRIVLHRSIPDDDILRRQWNDLVQRMEQPEVFFTYEWALSVYRSYSQQMFPILFLAYDENSLVGVVALATDHSGEAFFLAGTTADYCDFICHPRHRRELLDRVFEELKRLDVGMLRLANLPLDSATIHALKQSARRSGYSCFARPAYSCAQVAIDSPEKRETVKESAQRRVRRYGKTLGRKIPVTIHHSTALDDINSELPHFARAHVARFLATGRISNLARPERRVFLEELARSLSASGSVKFSRLSVNGETVAWNYGFRFAESWFWYQPTFLSSFQQFSPGMWLLSKIVEESCDDLQLNRIDLGLGAEGYKERLATASRQTFHMTATVSTVSCWKERIRYHLAAVVRSVPRLEAWTRAGIRRLNVHRARLATEGLHGYLKIAGRHLRQAVSSQSQSIFLEWSPEKLSRTPQPVPASSVIQPVNLELLATAAMHYVDDLETAAYLLRAAERLRTGESKGFAVVALSDSVPLHFCWVTSFEKFLVKELKHSTNLPPPDAALIVDCWTPFSVRRRGHYIQGIAALASQLQHSEKYSSIFISASNGFAVLGAEKAGFVRRFSLLYKRFIISRRVIESQMSISPQPGVEVSSAA